MSDRLSRIAADLRSSSAGLHQAVESAHAQVYEGASPAGLISVQVDGRCRVTSLRLDPQVARQDPEAFDAMVTGTVNDALALARSGTRAALSHALPPDMRSLLDRAVDEAHGESRR